MLDSEMDTFWFWNKAFYSPFDHHDSLIKGHIVHLRESLYEQLGP